MKAGKKLGIFLIAGTLFAIATFGCSKNRNEEDSNNQNITVVIPPIVHEEVTLYGTIRKVYLAGSNVLIEEQSPYRTGGYRHLYYRDDGTLEKTEETYPSTAKGKEPTCLSTATWSSDGKTLLHGEMYYTDGTCMYVKDNLSDGTCETSFYLPGANGYRLFSARGSTLSRSLSTNRANRNWQQDFYRQDGSILAKRYLNSFYTPKGKLGNSVEKKFELYKANGKLFCLIEHLSPWETSQNNYKSYTAGDLYTYYKEDGTPSHRQFWSGALGSFTQENHSLKSVQELDEECEVTREYFVSDEGRIVRLDAVRIFGTNNNDITWDFISNDTESYEDESGEPTIVDGENNINLEIELYVITQTQERVMRVLRISPDMICRDGEQDTPENKQKAIDDINPALFKQLSEQDLKDFVTSVSSNDYRKGIALFTNASQEEVTPCRWYVNDSF